MTPVVNLGQSKFQDTYFVAQAQMSPYRQLRQIELEMRAIEDSLKRASFAQRRLELKIAKLDENDPAQAIDKEEAQWDLHSQKDVILDAMARYEHFKQLREELIAGVPQEYWDIGFENAECDHWVRVLTNELTMMRLTGAVSHETLKQIALMPQEAQRTIMISASQEYLRLAPSINAEFAETQAITDQTNSAGAEGEAGPNLRLVLPSAD